METTPNISVGIIRNNTINFNLSGKFTVHKQTQAFYGRCIATLKDQKIKIQNAYNEVDFTDEVIFLPCSLNSDYFEIYDVVIGIDFHWEQKEKQRFQGALYLKATPEGIQVINTLPLENYLISVISSEMSANSSLELLKAHAVISRSWLLAQIEKSKQLKHEKLPYKSVYETEDELIRWYDREDHELFHVCADDHCQRYQGITRAQNPNVIKAINETRGLVLVSGGKICDSRFSKCCGGISELFENVWEPVHHKYLTKVIDNPVEPEGFNTNLTLEDNAVKWIKSSPEAFCNTTDNEILSQVLNDYDLQSKDFYRWNVHYTQQELKEIIAKKSGKDFGDILDLIPVERGESGRLIKLKIIGSKKSLIIGKELEIRRLLSPSHLYSSAFIVEKDKLQDGIPAGFTLLGAGWGHGVGLCQIGAAVMGHKNYTFDQILFHYFTNSELEKKY